MNDDVFADTTESSKGKEEIAARKKKASEYYQKNRDRLKEYAAQKRAQNPTKGMRVFMGADELARLRERDRIKKARERANDGGQKQRAACGRWYARNKDKVRETNARWYSANRKRAVADAARRRIENIDVFRARERAQAEAIKNDPERKQKRLETRRKYITARVANDKGFALLKRIRGRVLSALARNRTFKTNSTILLIGCSKEHLRKHLESQFKKGMNWENHGTVWHIDHMVPCAAFDLTTKEGQEKCFHFTNLRPLWSVENMSKNAKIITCQPELLISLV